jgi:hypothetical protein
MNSAQANPYRAASGLGFWSVKQYGVAAAIIMTTLFAAALHAYAPAALHLPACPFHQWTGLYCPGCGSTRALHHLLNFEFVAALRCNLMLVILLPFLALWFGSRALATMRFWRGPVLDISAGAGWWLTAMILAWWMVRNLPFACFVIPKQ